MNPDHLLLLAAAIALIAFLYASVGHAGASGYIAVMALFHWTPEQIKPAALMLNILVAAVGTWQFCRAGHFSWPLFWPFAVLAVPASFCGGYLQLSSAVIKPLLGAVLIFSAVRLFFRRQDPAAVSSPAMGTALAAGAGIGLLSGLTGTGGGIFLTPLLLFCGWARTKTAAAVSAVFILLNSTAGLAGHALQGKAVPFVAWPLAVAALAGGVAGAHLGSRRFPVFTISLLLAAVLIIAGAKLIFTA